MRVTVSVLLVLISLVARAEPVATALFAIEVPDGWNIEDNKSSVVLVMGDRVRDRMPMPFLSIQYCFSSEPAQDSFQRRCGEPCSEEGLALPAEARGMRFSPVVKEVSAEGVTEYRMHAISPPGASAFAALLCSQGGQVYVSLVSDEPREQTERMFNDVVSSLRRNQR